MNLKGREEVDEVLQVRDGRDLGVLGGDGIRQRRKSGQKQAMLGCGK